GVEEAVRRVSEGDARAGASGRSRGRIRFASADAAVAPHRAGSRVGAGGKADRGFCADREGDLELDQPAVAAVVAAIPSAPPRACGGGGGGGTTPTKTPPPPGKGGRRAPRAETTQPTPTTTTPRAAISATPVR